jgi:hypothetical protein
MAKFLIGTLDGKVRSAHNPPLDFSISGRYVVDVPQDLSVEAKTDSLPELLHEKVVAIQNRAAVRQVPSGTQLKFALSDELLVVPNVDAVLSARCMLGPNKRSALMKNGVLWTNPLLVSATTSYAYFHWYGFRLWADEGPEPPAAVPVRPDPPRVLYNYDPVAQSFIEFNPGDLTVEVWSVGSGPSFAPVARLLTASYEVVQAFSFASGNVRLKFINNLPATIWLSDWLFLYNSTV